MIRTTSRLLAPALGLLAAFAVAAPATAGTASVEGTDASTAITTAVTSSPETAGVPAGSYTVQDVRTAATAPDWAAAEITPTAASADQLDPATVVLQQVGGSWTVVSLGTAFVGCDETTPAVQADLALLC